MKRDPRLLYTLLKGYENESIPDVSDWKDEEVAYHTVLLIEGGALRGSVEEIEDGQLIPIVNGHGPITVDGYTLLQAMNTSSFWTGLKQVVGFAGNKIAFPLLLEYAKQLLKTP